MNIDNTRKQAIEHFQAGRLMEAITTQLGVINATKDSPEITDFHQISFILYALNDFPAIIQFLSHALTLWPDDYDLLKNIGIAYNRVTEYNKANELFLKALSIKNDDVVLYDALASNAYSMGNSEAAIKYGEQSLVLKNSYYSTTPLKLNAAQQANNTKNVIAFSLWGDHEKYTSTAINNARLVDQIYPGWEARFYIDSTVSETVRSQLLATGATLIMMPDQTRLYEGLFWRFKVACDPSVNHFLIRDADSLINIREAVAVNEWLSSDKSFHIMRDWYTHTELILAGMWGGKACVLPPFESYINAYLESPTKTRNCDQFFLKEIIWPAIRRDCLIHDRLFRVLDAKPFPANTELPGNRHVGQNEAVNLIKSGAIISDPDTTPEWKLRERLIFTITTGRSGTQYLTELLKLNLKDAEVYHERMSYIGNGKSSPDLSHFTRFNTLGNTLDVQSFWKQKLAGISYGTSSTYAELSHYLTKAGLLENINLIDPSISIDIIILKRDVLDIAWSYANRFEFTNNGYTWLFALDPQYPRNIIDYTPYKQHGAFGSCVWYAHEMGARAEYYKLILKHQNVRLHEYQLSDISNQPGAHHLLNSISENRALNEIVIPPKQNSSKQWYFNNEVKDQIRQIVDSTTIDLKTAAQAYIDSGKSLG